MKMTKTAHRWLGLQNAIFYLLVIVFIGMLAYVSLVYKYDADWTYGNRNSLSAPTQELLKSLDKPLLFIAYIPDRPELEAELRKMTDKYRRFKADTTIKFVNPDLDPVRAKQDGVQYSGQLAVYLGDKHELVDETGEEVITSAIQRMSRNSQRLVVFLEGHGERNPLAVESTGLSKLVEKLKSNGFNIQPHNLIKTQSIPSNASFAVIAGPQQDYLPGEVDILKKYVEQGGNLLWLQDPGGLHGLQPLENLLGLKVLDGTVIDANQELHKLLGINHPAVIPIVDYSHTEIVANLANSQTLFPFATMVAKNPEALKNGALVWQADEFLTTLSTSWLESGGVLEGAVKYDEGSNDQPGPLPIGVTLTRKVAAQANIPEHEQRVVVIGDSDFMLNSFIGYGANLDLATNVFNWLSKDDQLVKLPIVRAPDTELKMNNNLLTALATLFLIILPVGLVAIGLFIWWRRRSR